MARCLPATLATFCAARYAPIAYYVGGRSADPRHRRNTRCEQNVRSESRGWRSGAAATPVIVPGYSGDPLESDMGGRLGRD